LAFAGGLASLALRWHRAGPGSPGRRQIGLLLAASVLLVVAFALEAPPPQPVWQIVLALVIVTFGPVAIGMAILRHGLYDIDLVVNRSLVYGLLTGLVIGIYGGTVWIIGRFVDVGSPAVTAVATAVVAAVLLPLRAGLQRVVDRLMYGDRGDPWQAVSRLASQLEGATAPGSATDGIVSGIATSLRLPYVAVRTAAGVVAETGSPGTLPLSEFSLSAAGEPVGVLIVAGRDRRRLGSRDRTVLVELARHAGAAVHGAQLADALHASREQLVTTREEERRRLRRDLHDGLGPTLAGVALGLDCLDGLLVTDPGAARLLIADLKAEATNSITDVRRVVYGLRPPALDEFGLVRAIAARVDRVRSGHPELTIRFDVPDELPALSAAAEVAAYRIAVEAISNVARHARAHICNVRILIASDEELQLEVTDDGIGINGNAPGVGLTGMRERAAELGGRCTVSANSSGGVRVMAALPLRSVP
jgi:two-component system NarL family sensor kinase